MEALIGNWVFISHSSLDKRIRRMVRSGFAHSGIRPIFLEALLIAHRPTKEIIERIEHARALFVFFTRNLLRSTTRDWIIFELGIAAGNHKPIYAWKASSVAREKIPRLVDQLSTYREFSTTSPIGRVRLKNDIIRAVRSVTDSGV